MKKIAIPFVIILLSVYVASASSIDTGGYKIYNKIVNLGKWVILIKAAIDIIQKVTSGDFESAKRNFMSYLLIYASLYALPWGLEEIEAIMKGM